MFCTKNPVVTGSHTRNCCVQSGVSLDSYNWEGRLKEEEVHKDDDVMSTNVTIEMTLKTQELACTRLTTKPEMIWRKVRAWADVTYPLWHGLLQHQVCELVRKACRDLGLGDTIGTVENTPAYNPMKDTGRPLLHCSACFPNPTKLDTNMRMMILANPTNLGLLKGPVDLYCDAMFQPCCPANFYQCLIVTIYDHSTSSFVPILYALMTHNCEELYSQVFKQIFILSGNEMKCCTYTTDFEQGLMNMLCETFSQNGGVHVGCLFHFKQALRKYLIKNVDWAFGKYSKKQ